MHRDLRAALDQLGRAEYANIVIGAAAPLCEQRYEHAAVRKVVATYEATQAHDAALTEAIEGVLSCIDVDSPERKPPWMDVFIAIERMLNVYNAGIGKGPIDAYAWEETT
jgi:hypothetical protein